MREEREILIELGWAALRKAFGHSEKVGGGAGPFSGRNHRPKGRDGGGFKTGAGRVHVSETKKSGRSIPLLPDSQKLTGFIHRCIAELNPIEQLWAHFCYRDQCQKQGESGRKFMRTYAEQYCILYMNGCRAGTRAVIREMIAFRMKQVAGEIPLAAQFESDKAVISRQLWRQTFKGHWSTICGDLDRVDESVLFKVGVKVNLYESF